MALYSDSTSLLLLAAIMKVGVVGGRGSPQGAAQWVWFSNAKEHQAGASVIPVTVGVEGPVLENSRRREERVTLH